MQRLTQIIGLIGCVISSLASAQEPFDPFAEAATVWQTEFGVEVDRNYDRLPDDWTRRTGPGFPNYVEVVLDESAGDAGDGSLRFDANGASAAMYGPVLTIDDRHDYLFSVRIRTENLAGDAAVCSLSILNDARNRIARYLTPAVSGGNGEWTTVTIGPIAPARGQQFLVVGCHLVQGAELSLDGHAWFDNLRVGAMPSLELALLPHAFRKPDEVTDVSVRLAGLDAEGEYQILLWMTDVDDREIARKQQSVLPGSVGEEPLLSWSIPPQPPGFYQVHARVRGRDVSADQTVNFVVATPAEMPEPGFAWSVERLPESLDAEALISAARYAGTAALRWPLWRNTDETDYVAFEQDLLVQAAANEVEMLGLLDPPPEKLAALFGSSWPGMFHLLRLRRETWADSLASVVARYGPRIEYWQLGRDGDTSFAQQQDLDDLLKSVRGEFGRIGRNVQLAVPWDVPDSAPAVAALSRAVDNRLPLTESSASTASPRATANAPQRWFGVTGRNLESQSNLKLSDGAADLVFQILRAKRAHADRVFYNDVFGTTGLLTPHGTPTSLYLPWRTTALACLGGTDSGSLRLPGASENRVLLSKSSATIALWRSETATERLTLGGHPIATDVWGRPVPLRVDGGVAAAVTVGPTPIFITGASAPLLDWQLTARFENAQLESRYGPQTAAIVGRNPFPQGVSGTIEVRLPTGWDAEPNRWPLQLAAGETFRLPLTLTLPNEVNQGLHDATLVFQINADRDYEFAIPQPLRVGSDEIQLRVEEQRLPDGSLEITQTIINQTNPTETLTFLCSLYAPGRQRQRQYVIRLEAGEDVKRYYLPQGAELSGQTLRLRAEQEHGTRVLNYRWNSGEMQ